MEWIKINNGTASKLDQIHPLRNLFFMWNHDFRAPSAREICADVCYNAFRGTLTLREDACVYVYLCEISKNSRQKYQFTWFFLTDFFFSKLEQFLRTCSPMVRFLFWNDITLRQQIFQRSHMNRKDLRVFDQIFRLFDFVDLNFTKTLSFLNKKFFKSEGFTLSRWVMSITCSRKMKNSKIFIQILSNSFSKKSVFHVKSRLSSTLS